VIINGGKSLEKNVMKSGGWFGRYVCINAFSQLCFEMCVSICKFHSVFCGVQILRL